ncbi:MAG TPA: ABC transporter permease [Candidatus Kapabacteria bacterium]|nr:ABC transporter permease [Candidatus Kapabacteria bacterium]
MLVFTIRKFFYAILIIFGVMTILFLVMNLLPDPARMMQGQRADLSTQAAIRHELGLDLPAWQRYLNFIGKVATGDLGRSFSSNRPVLDSILERFPATVILTVSAMLIATILGVAIGILSAVKSYSALDNVSMIFALVGISVPSFVFGLLMVIAFGSWLQIFPISGYVIQDDAKWYEFWAYHWDYLALPMLTLALRPISIIARVTRSSMLDVLSSDYIRTAKSKGLSNKKVIFKHGLRNALNPVVTTVGSWLAALLTGAFFIEYIFNWPGVGALAFDAIPRSDFPTIQGTVLFAAILFVVINYFIDILYAKLDPKVKLS